MQTIVDAFMTDVLPALFSLIGAACAVIITKKVIPYLTSKLNKNDLDTLKIWIEALVWSAQRLYESGALHIPKKEYAMNAIIKYAAEHGIRLSAAQLDELRRAAVKQLEILEAQITEFGVKIEVIE